MASSKESACTRRVSPVSEQRPVPGSHPHPLTRLTSWPIPKSRRRITLRRSTSFSRKCGVSLRCAVNWTVVSVVAQPDLPLPDSPPSCKKLWTRSTSWRSRLEMCAMCSLAGTNLLTRKCVGVGHELADPSITVGCWTVVSTQNLSIHATHQGSHHQARHPLPPCAESTQQH